MVGCLGWEGGGWSCGHGGRISVKCHASWIISSNFSLIRARFCEVKTVFIAWSYPLKSPLMIIIINYHHHQALVTHRACKDAENRGGWPPRTSTFRQKHIYVHHILPV